MKALIVSDLHLTDRPLDSYRWRVFEQLKELSTVHGVSDLFVLGDLTEFKDHHSSRLVNKIVDGFYFLRKASRINEIYMLKGNHDGIDPACPYFRFLDRLPWCHFYVEPTWLEMGKDTILMLPHTRTPKTDWEALEFGNASHIFLHATLKGAVAETGVALESDISVDLFKGLRACIISGDVHVPQTVGKVVEYVGAPYPIRFGDTFSPQVLLLDGKKKVSIPVSNIHKLTLDCTASGLSKEVLVGISPGDQVKVRMVLADSELGVFHELKSSVLRAVREARGELCQVVLVKKEGNKPKIGAAKGKGTEALKPLETMLQYCKANKVQGQIQEVGEDIVEEGTNEA